MTINTALGQRLIDLREKIVANFTGENWEEVGLLTGFSDIINKHHRLLRSLSWNDEDYSGNVLTILRRIAQQDANAITVIEDYITEKFPSESHYVSAKPSERKITFAPNVFSVPDSLPESDLVSVIMPFTSELRPVYVSIRNACVANGLRCLKANDIWEESTIIQDIFNLIFKAQVVVVDFSTKNPNVMYETGIAHTLGKHVIPISQSLEDVPFDMTHHRVLKYLNNGEGLRKLELELTTKLSQFKQQPDSREEDNVPF